jgi:hypothetical protein
MTTIWAQLDEGLLSSPIAVSRCGRCGRRCGDDASDWVSVVVALVGAVLGAIMAPVGAASAARRWHIPIQASSPRVAICWRIGLVTRTVTA